MGRVTSAVHQYLITEGRPRPDVRKQYLKDFRERWMQYDDPNERHRKSRAFFGKMAELQCAEWLESQGWTISGLEAYGAVHDIEPSRGDCGVTAFEVKYIGVEDNDFAKIVKSLTGQDAGGPVSPQAAANFVLFKTYDAAKQLQKLVVAVSLRSLWMRRHGGGSRCSLGEIGLAGLILGSFLMTVGAGKDSWPGKLLNAPARYSTIATDLQPVLQRLDAIWILRRLDGYQYHLEVEIP